eukprot:m.297127 g.297127  ORF g.297127 m.297127 type:complete len:469 (+) comp20075_c1_seq9:150-1556(+)
MCRAFSSSVCLSLATLFLQVVCAVTDEEQAQQDSVVVPEWSSHFPTAKQYCVDASNAKNPGNKRFVFVATPEGTPPKNGWPVYFSFVTDVYPDGEGGSGCGIADKTTMKRATAFSTPEDSLKHCPCIKDNTCKTRSLSSHRFSKKDRLVRINARGSGPTSVMAAAYENETGVYGSALCQYDTLAGELWDMRLKQFIVANKIAVVQVNPSSDDGWLAYDEDPSGGPTWSSGSDKPFLYKVFEMLKNGDLGNLDASNVVVRGWSGGAQMVSWMFQLAAVRQIPHITIKAGMFLAGGSYECYAASQAAARTTCKKCNPGILCPGGAWHQNAGCSTNLSHAPCCTKCCPANFTEQFYFEHPEQYPQHPPAFLSQLSTEDENADLCACKNYHDTLVANGVYSELVLTTPAYERCFCIGDPNDPAARGSPYAKYCLHDVMTWRCFTHEMGFAEMVIPAVQFLQRIFKGATLHQP